MSMSISLAPVHTESIQDFIYQVIWYLRRKRKPR